jgi:Na+/H+ antiporter NhaD/arsenite permease-like protein
MIRTTKEIQDAVALLKAMTVVVNIQGNQHLFGDAVNTIGAAIAEIHEEKKD